MTSKSKAGVDKVANVLDCDKVVSEFELLSHYHVHFRNNGFKKHLISPVMG